MTSLRDRVCVVTGASAGIGEAVGRTLAGQGATVVLVARREERLKEIAEALGPGPGAVDWVRCDVSDAEDVKALVDEVERRHGRCDVLVNNAGIPGGGPFADLTLEQVERVVAINQLGVLYCTKLFLPMLLASRGHVVNVASAAGRYALPGAAVYTATKHAVVAFSEALYHELRPSGVMVTSVNPGLVLTERFRHEQIRRNPALKRFVMPPQRIADVVVEAIRRRRGPEITVPRWLGSLQAVRVLAPPVYRAALGRLVGNRATEARPD